MGVSCLLFVKQGVSFWKNRCTRKEKKKHLSDSVYDLCRDWCITAQEETHLLSDFKSLHALRDWVCPARTPASVTLTPRPDMFSCGAMKQEKNSLLNICQGELNAREGGIDKIFTFGSATEHSRILW